MNARIAALLVERGEKLLQAGRVRTLFTREPAADDLLNDLEGHPHAFVLACVADRQIKAEKAWMIPHELSKRLGGFSFDHLRSVSQEAMHEAFTRPTALHWLAEGMSRSFHEAIQRIADIYGGDAAAIWRGEPPSAEVVFRFLEFRGIGPKIATMATNILARDFKVPLSDYYSVDVSADVHLRRVFARLGLIGDGATVEEAVYRARALHPPFPGLMDLPAWEIGRQWCRPKEPQCAECYMRSACPTGRGELKF